MQGNSRQVRNWGFTYSLVGYRKTWLVQIFVKCLCYGLSTLRPRRLE